MNLLHGNGHTNTREISKPYPSYITRADSIIKSYQNTVSVVNYVAELLLFKCSLEKRFVRAENIT